MSPGEGYDHVGEAVGRDPASEVYVGAGDHEGDPRYLPTGRLGLQKCESQHEDDDWGEVEDERHRDSREVVQAYALQPLRDGVARYPQEHQFKGGSPI
jgi:hypothetical protein